jgi:hypothetical protein
VELIFNRAWLVSLAIDFEREKKQNISYAGFDVQTAHYPAPGNLPDNMKLGVLDAFADDVAAEHVGQYDVVRVRAFASVVKADNPGPVLKNAYKMLKREDIFNGTIWMAVPTRQWLQVLVQNHPLSRQAQLKN